MQSKKAAKAQNNSEKFTTDPLAAGHQSFSLLAFHFSLKKGFTLLETMVALAVITAAVVGPVSLITKGIFDFSFAKNKIIAANLAQEGMELVRAVRDNNILCDSINGSVVWEWNRDPGGGLLSSTAREISADSVTTIACGSSSITTPRLPLFTSQKLKFNSASGLYGYSGEDTIFTRKVEMVLPPQGPDQSIATSDQMDIIVTVDWIERDIARNIVLRERLYNWK